MARFISNTYLGVPKNKNKLDKIHNFQLQNTKLPKKIYGKRCDVFYPSITKLQIKVMFIDLSYTMKFKKSSTSRMALMTLVIVRNFQTRFYLILKKKSCS